MHMNSVSKGSYDWQCTISKPVMQRYCCHLSLNSPHGPPTLTPQNVRRIAAGPTTSVYSLTRWAGFCWRAHVTMPVFIPSSGGSDVQGAQTDSQTWYRDLPPHRAPVLCVTAVWVVCKRVRRCKRSAQKEGCRQGVGFILSYPHLRELPNSILLGCFRQKCEDVMGN